ncbi:MAG: hypothetical protein E7359_04230 [Clostridiales bacterium]|nr:hypothetical protein [Clostridiales bacterium]
MISEIVAIISVVISIASTIVAIFAITYSKKLKDFDLNQQNYEDVKDWYEEVLKILKELYLQFAVLKQDDKQKLNTVLTKLSSKIDMGRLYFPNKIDGEFGINKPKAYRGRRALIIDFLVFYYDIFFYDKHKENLDILTSVQRAFVSEMTLFLSKNQNSAVFVKYNMYDKKNIINISNLDNAEFRKILISDDVVELVDTLNNENNN